MRFFAFTCIAVILASSLGSITRADAQPSFTEDFTTTTYKDNANTTARWRTHPGRLELWPHLIKEVAAYPLTNPKAMDLEGSDLFVLADNSQMVWFDVSDPDTLVFVGVINGLSNPRGLDVVGDRVYIADGSNGFVGFDLNNLVPVGLGGVPTTTEAVHVVGNLAYVAGGTSGIQIYDVTGIGAFPLVGSYNTPGIALDIQVQGNYCYIADANGGLQIVDVSDPSSPAPVGSYPSSNLASEVVVQGNVAYFSDSVEGLVAVDITDPTNPVLLNSLPGVEGWSLAVAGNTAYLGRDTDVLAIDISNPSTLSPFTNVPSGGGTTFDMATNGEYLYISDGSNGMVRTIEVREPAPVLEVASVDPGSIEDVALEGNTLYGAGADFYSVDVTDPENPLVLDTLVLPNAGQGFDVDGDFAFVAVLDSGMVVVDVSDPSNLAVAGSFPRVGMNFHGVAKVAGDVCLLGGSGLSDQLHVLDVSDPTSPSLISSFSLSGTPEDIVIQGSLAFIAVRTLGLEIVDISNPASPFLVESFPVAYTAHSILVERNIVYLAAEDEGLFVIDATYPTLPFTLFSLATPGSFTTGLARSGTYLYTSVDGEGLWMVDVSNPATPQLMEFGRGYNAADPRRLVAAGDYVYQATRFDGLDVLKVMSDEVDPDRNSAASLTVGGGTDPIMAVKLTSLKTGGADWALSVDGGSTWNDYPFEGLWMVLNDFGTELRWSVEISQSATVVSPVIDQIDIRMAHGFPVILGVEDIANDQGRQVRVTWQFSGHDVLTSSTPILNYGIYRKVDPDLGSVAVENTGASSPSAEPALAGWDFVGLHPASAEPEYSMVVSTLADSSISGGDYHTSFMVRALTGTPSTFFDSPPDSGYSLDNLAPEAPGNFALAGSGLSWDESAAEDFNYFTVYGSETSAFDETATMITNTTNTGLDVSGFPHAHYHLTATDFSGNRSAAASTGNAADIPSGSFSRFALYPNVPNPFNPLTTIRFELPSPARTLLRVFGVDGRLIKTLVAGDTLEGGAHDRTWDGTDEFGNRVGAGVYFYMLEAGPHTETRRMVLVK